MIIATPDHWHAPAAIMACQAGKDVYVEKPCAHNMREGRMLVEAARKYQRIVQHGTQARSRASTRKAIEIVHSGKIGKVLMAKAWDVQKRKDIGHKPDSPVPPGVDYDTWVGPAEWMPFNENRFHYNWHWHWNFGTGDMGNDGAHQVDQARWALGVDYPAEVSGIASSIDVPVYVVAVVSPLDHVGQSSAVIDEKGSPAGELMDLAQWTGGDAFLSSTVAQSGQAVKQIVDELRFQYLIAFEPGGRPGWHPLEVKLRDRHLSVRARGGYFAGPSSGS
jgi:predicted dehydrogenase